MDPQQPPQSGGIHGPTGRRLHIAHRRSPSELTPLMSMFSNPGSKPRSPSGTLILAFPSGGISRCLYFAYCIWLFPGHANKLSHL